jgi:hypothetical protein
MSIPLESLRALSESHRFGNGIGVALRKGIGPMKPKKSAMSKVARAVKAVAATADEYVVEPVGKALGLIPPEPEIKSKSARKAERKAAIARAAKTKKNRKAI